MKVRILNLCLIISSLLGYLEWNGGNHVFLYAAEADIFTKLFTHPLEVIHPLIVLPFLGQIALVITVFQKVPSPFLTYLGIGCLGILLGLMLFVGLLSLNIKIILSTLPFWFLTVLVLLHFKKAKTS
jgi:hypothetical protein